ncbi:MAG: carbohydrate ABC transporter permease, partial [Candidatus Zixiibacteriota bacterium]
MRRRFLPAFNYLVLVVLLAIMVFPLVWMFRVSLMSAGGSLDIGRIFNADFTLANYRDLFSAHNMGRYLFNSLFVGVTVTVGNILFCFMVAYALARYKYLHNKLLFMTVIVVLMIPAHILIVPLYI